MDKELTNFLLQNIGIPALASIIKYRKQSNTLDTLTSEQVIVDYYTNIDNWKKQAQDWLAEHP